MILQRQKFNGLCVLILLITQFLTINIAQAQTAAGVANQAVVITKIEITGNERIETSTVESYLLLNIGDQYTDILSDRSLKRLYDTGLFSDVDIGRRGSVMVVQVSENPIINRIIFEGNKYKDDQDLYEEIQLRPRIVFPVRR